MSISGCHLAVSCHWLKLTNVVSLHTVANATVDISPTSCLKKKLNTDNNSALISVTTPKSGVKTFHSTLICQFM